MRKLIVMGLLVSTVCLAAPAAWAATTPELSWSDRSEQKNVLVGDASAPAAPSNLQASGVMTTQVQLSWMLNSSDATGIFVEGRLTGSGTFQQVGSVAGNATSVIVTNLQPQSSYDFRVRAGNGSGFSGYSNVVTVVTAASPSNCTPSTTTLCLVNNRFQVTATFLTGAGQSGSGQAVKLTDNSAYMWFFDPTNAELFLKVIDACSFNNAFWFFGSGLTNVQVTIDVVDTQSGSSRRYVNRLNTAFQPIQDTTAFGCP